MNTAIAKKIEDFFGKYPIKSFEKGHILAHAGDELPGVIYLLSGNVKQYDISEQGVEIVVNVFKPPAFFPMNWVINKTPNIYFFETVEQVSAKLAPPDDVIKFLKDNPGVVFDLLSRLYNGTDGLLRRMAHLMGGSARTRLLFELLNQCKRFGKKQPDGTYILNLHEDEFANRAGLSRETVNRELKKIKPLNLIEVNRSGIIVKNIEKLEEELGLGL